MTMSAEEFNVKWQDNAQRIASGIRLRVLEHTINSRGGYLSQACSSAETLAVLYTKAMQLAPSDAPLIPHPFPGVPSKSNSDYFTGAGYNGAHAPDLDRFFFSPAHYALALYAALVQVGRMASAGLAMFNQDGSSVEMIGAEHSPGIEVTCGSLGQTISQAAGVALARKTRHENGRVFVFMSDGEFQSGQTWEALQAMAFYKLDNMIVYVDVNGQQCDGRMEEVMKIEPLLDRLIAFGMRASRVDGHAVDALYAPTELSPDGRPLIILAYTNPCRGIDLLGARRPKLHYVRFKDEAERDQYAALLEEMKNQAVSSSR
jgi:transketolase